jgi:hypothetical protein
MQRLYETFPEDPDVTTFYALSLLALAATNPSDKSYALQYKAGSLLYWVRESHPNHPGVLHDSTAGQIFTGVNLIESDQWMSAGL